MKIKDYIVLATVEDVEEKDLKSAMAVSEKIAIRSLKALFKEEEITDKGRYVSAYTKE